MYDFPFLKLSSLSSPNTTFVLQPRSDLNQGMRIPLSALLLVPMGNSENNSNASQEQTRNQVATSENNPPTGRGNEQSVNNDDPLPCIPTNLNSAIRQPLKPLERSAEDWTQQNTDFKKQFLARNGQEKYI